MRRSAKIVMSLIVFFMIASALHAQSYSTYAESAKMRKEPISKASVIWILSDTTSFMWNRSIESSVKDQLTKKGIEVRLTTDLVDISQMEQEEFEQLGTMIRESDADYLLGLEMKDIYTFAIGEGIKSLDISATLFDFVTNTILLRIELSTEADTNDFESLNATRSPALRSMSESLAQEFMKYVK